VHPDDLLRAFNTFEERTRGRDVWPYRVPLEPLFWPILAVERTPRPSLDDSRKPGVWERLRAKRATPPVSLEAMPHMPEPRSGDSRDIAEFTLLVPDAFSVKGEVVKRLLSSLRTIRSRIAFEMIGTCDSISIQLACAVEDKHAVAGSLRAYFPEVKAREEVSALAEAWVSAGIYCSSLHLGLEGRVFHSLSADNRFDIDPFIEVVGRMEDLDEGELGLVQTIFEPARPSWGSELVAFANSIDDVDHVLSLIERKFAEPAFAVFVRTAALATDAERSMAIASSLATALHAVTRSEDNELALVPNGDHDVDTEAGDILDREVRRAGMILSLSELATLVHVPSASVRSGRLLRQSGRTKAAPALAMGNELILGTNEHDGDARVVSLSGDQRLRHVYTIGASGTGKSTLLLSMAAQDIARGNGFAVLDPHGDLVEDILAQIPEDRAKEVILFDPADEAYPIGFNILSAHSELERTLLASDLVSVFKRLSTTFGDVMVSVLGNAVLAFLESSEGGTLLDLRNFLVDPAFRDEVLKTVADDEVVSYWKREFTLLRGVPHAPVLTRLNTFLRPKLIRRMVAQKRDRLDFRRIMDKQTIFLAKLSHGAIGEENAHLLGSLLVSKIAQAAMSRQNIDLAERAPYTLYVDEFHHFVTPSIATILSGARKYGLGLVLAHQETRQLKSRNEDVASAVLSNAATRIAFRVGEQDAKALADGFSFFESKDLQSLGIGDAIARVERADFDFNLRTQRLETVPPELAVSRRAVILAASRASYGTPAEEVDAVLAAVREAAPDHEAAPPRQSGLRHRAKKAAPTEATEEPVSLPGRGGAQHKYLQSLVRRLADDRGFEVSLEKTVLDGHGHIDVALEGHGVTVACEISVTTKVEHEVGNLTKGLAAGFDYVVLISSDDRTLDLARAEMSGTDQKRVRILSPGGLAEFLDEMSATEPKARQKSVAKPSTQPQAGAYEGKHLLVAEDAAPYVGLARQTLAKMRVSGEGPPFHKIGRRVAYDRRDLDIWLALRKRRSTSDPGKRPT
jgi:hypothetical protein